MRSDIYLWNVKYENREPTASIDPDTLLLQHRGLLGSRGLCIDIAGGTGDNGLYLSQLGYRSIIVDGSEAGLRLCRYKARENGLTPLLLAADLDRFMLPRSTFDAVLVFRYLNRALIGNIYDCLKVNGLLFYKTFNDHHLVKHPHFPENYMLRDGELTEWFSDLHCVETNDGATDDVTYSWVGYK
ncbi:MAG: hypothetical protein MAG794_01148 [Gammaproteobacteria bacterium]|nr:hypothetical protein [Gammaproteobacteria bacterium]